MGARRDTFSGILRSMRMHQWVKNLFVLAPLVFAQELLNAALLARSLAAFFLFCLASSTVYLLNDLADADADRAHPVKCKRPIASGAVSRDAALRTIVLFAIGSVGVGFWLRTGFGAALLGYLVLNVAYSSRLKRIAYVDVLCIAAGFELRVIGGAFAAEVPPSAYLLVVTLLLATFLGFGKRMHELVQGERAHEQRSVLKAYDQRVLSPLLSVTGALTVLTYAIYTLDSHTRTTFHTDYLVATTVFTAFGVFRFLRLVRTDPETESPTEQMLRDPLFLGNLALWTISVLAIIYFA
ncbi:MAG: decaprenyl-phosphate phosphoribosyltransferase [Polyangiales bacterium]|nr:decaprenyl-phosphate phosphoribosyltransferase [Myxococcales bacterium]